MRKQGPILLAAVLLAGCSSHTVIEQAHEQCDKADGKYSGQLGSDGRSVVVDGVGQDAEPTRRTNSITSTVCLIEELEAPSSVLSRMETTRALDGTQDAEHGDLHWRWSYHPDSGLNVLVEVTD